VKLLGRIRRTSASDDSTSANGKAVEAVVNTKEDTVAHEPATQREFTKLRLQRPTNETVLDMLLKAEVNEVLELALPALWLFRERELAKIKAELEANDRAISRLTMQRDDVLSVETQTSAGLALNSVRNLPRFSTPTSPSAQEENQRQSSVEVETEPEPPVENSASVSADVSSKGLLDSDRLAAETNEVAKAETTHVEAASVTKPRRGRPPRSQHQPPTND
jgi:DNA repair exonuclease SbcCD nuclease subunit